MNDVTLRKRLYILTCILLGLLYVGLMGIQLGVSRSHLEAQLLDHAYDVGVAYAEAISPLIVAGNVPAAEKLAESILKKASFNALEVTDKFGVSLLRRDAAAGAGPSRRWLSYLLPFDLPKVIVDQDLITDKRIRVAIEVNPDRLYEMLWTTVVGSFWWLLLLVIVAQLLVSLAFNRFIAGLLEVEKAALNVASRRFMPITEETPFHEMSSLTAAMNTMVQNVEAMVHEQTSLADRLRDEAFTDAVTGLNNRRAFEMRLKSVVREHDSCDFGALLLVRVEGLKPINDKSGIQAGDRVLAEVANVVRDGFTFHEKRLVARVSGTDMAIFVPCAELKDVKLECEKLSKGLSQVPARTDQRMVAYVGASAYMDRRDISELMAIADAALRTAQQKGPFAWSLSAIDSIETRKWTYSTEAWRGLIDRALLSRSLTLVEQPVVNRERHLVHREIFVRISDDHGELIPAGVFLPVVERFGLASEFDRLVLQTLMQRLDDSNQDREPYAVNLSAASVISPEFLDWLYSALLVSPHYAAGLIVEVSEYVLQTQFEAVKMLFQRLRALGVGTSLDHFGIGFATVGYLRSMAVDYVKLDGSYIRGIAENADNRNIIRVFTEVSRGYEITMIAESVETEDDWVTVLGLGVDGGRGILFGKPEEIKTEIPVPAFD